MTATFIAVPVAAVVAFVLSSTFYAVATPFERRLLGGAAPVRDARPSPVMILLELTRSMLTAGVLAGVARAMDLSAVGPTLLLAGALWLGFPFVLLTGSVLWDKAPRVTAVMHGGDWLVKLLAMAAVVGLVA
ncbi:DUF1761 domain-containing protein [Nonomuraea sp. NPDC059194]|uniref:DUF1761 domain-containing protein n=1 Tax=Nonomuraea sp. NPDC059194 TaxID=3346764 RepID=UPI00368AA80E